MQFKQNVILQNYLEHIQIKENIYVQWSLKIISHKT